MLFSSMTFIYVFLPVVCTIYLLAKKELHNAILLGASIIFYAWGEPKYLAIMLLSIIVNYYGAILIDKYLKYKKLTLFITILTNLGFLIYFKYFNFILENINNIFHSHISALDIVMPIGISFYTFQAVSYVVDVYRKEVPVQKNFYKLSLFICLFPQLIAGPIVKYHDVKEQIDDREVCFDKVSLGVKRFIIGLSKKVILANSFGAIADKIFTQSPDTFSHAIAWLGAVSYSFQLYFDFSGYSDMAIGLGLIFGFKFMENFNYPYISKSISEFWRRWHISLSTWFKQYVYIPLGGNRCSKLKTMRNLGIVFLLTGIWHGAAWNFLIWGAWNGFFIILEKAVNLKEFEQRNKSKWISLLQHLYCILVFVIGWVMFRAEDMTYAFSYLKNMFGFMKINPDNVLYNNIYYGDRVEVLLFVIAIMCSMPIFRNILNIENKFLKTIINLWLLILFIISSISIAASTYNPFIYFRF